MKILGLILMGMLTAIAFSAYAGEKGAEKPTLHMKHTAGWTSQVLSEFTVHKDGTFLYKAKKVVLRGRIPQTEIKAMLQQIATAGAGPTAKDAGYVQFKWIDKDGKVATKDYSDPEKDPCNKLLGEMKVLVARYSKNTAELKNAPDKK
jgi:hypothetical protein